MLVDAGDLERIDAAADQGHYLIGGKNYTTGAKAIGELCRVRARPFFIGMPLLRHEPMACSFSLSATARGMETLGAS